MEVRLRQKAKEDLISIWRYRAEHWGIKQADDYLWQLDHRLCLIELIASMLRVVLQ